MGIFISYRRADSANVGGRIYDRLVEHFGDQAVFKDVDDIPFGIDFKNYLNDVVAKCAVELVIIGPAWLTVTGEDGQRRLDDPDDIVRLEVETALNRDIPVIPVLVSSAPLPKAAQLPASIQKLPLRNGTLVRPDPDFHRDMDRLVKGLESYVTPLPKKSARSVAFSQPELIATTKSPALMKQMLPLKGAILALVLAWTGLMFFIDSLVVGVLVETFWLPTLVFGWGAIILFGNVLRSISRRWLQPKLWEYILAVFLLTIGVLLTLRNTDNLDILINFIVGRLQK